VFLSSPHLFSANTLSLMEIYRFRHTTLLLIGLDRNEFGACSRCLESLGHGCNMEFASKF